MYGPSVARSGPHAESLCFRARRRCSPLTRWFVICQIRRTAEQMPGLCFGSRLCFSSQVSSLPIPLPERYSESVTVAAANAACWGRVDRMRLAMRALRPSHAWDASTGSRRLLMSAPSSSTEDIQHEAGLGSLLAGGVSLARRQVRRLNTSHPQRPPQGHPWMACHLQTWCSASSQSAGHAHSCSDAAPKKSGGCGSGR